MQQQRKRLGSIQMCQQSKIYIQHHNTCKQTKVYHWICDGFQWGLHSSRSGAAELPEFCSLPLLEFYIYWNFVAAIAGEGSERPHSWMGGHGPEPRLDLCHRPRQMKIDSGQQH